MSKKIGLTAKAKAKAKQLEQALPEELRWVLLIAGAYTVGKTGLKLGRKMMEKLGAGEDDNDY